MNRRHFRFAVDESNLMRAIDIKGFHVGNITYGMLRGVSKNR